MTTTIVPLLEHLTSVYHGDPEGPDFGWWAQCSCGWVSDRCDDDYDAEDAAQDHREVAVDPPDGLDRLMDELLDVQEDLAGVVVWLAENWAADLPVPYCHGSYTGPGERLVDVQVHCRDDVQLARVASLLGTAVADRRYSQEPATCYRVARRHFGRVMVEAWTVHR